MKSSVDYASRFSAAGYEQAQYDAEYLGGKKYKEDVIIDSRWRDCGTQAAYICAVAADPVMYLRDNMLLFRHFAHLSRNDIVNFANQYGLLGVPAIQKFGGHPSATGTRIVNPFGHRNLVYAEHINDWCFEKHEMNEVLERFELVLQLRQDNLEGYQRLVARERLAKLFDGDVLRIKHEFSHPDIQKYCDKGDVESAELAYIGLRINRQLHQYTSLTLAWNLKDKSSKLQYKTDKLLGALWLQFAEYVTQARRMNFCRACNTPIPIVGRSARSDKDTCSAACRKRASRLGNTVRPKKRVPKSPPVI